MYNVCIIIYSVMERNVEMYTYVLTVQFVKFVHHFFTRNRATLLWLVQETSGYGIAAVFAKHAAIFAKCTAMRRTHRIFTAKGGALQHGHQSAALLVGEKWRTCCHVFKCRCGTFVSFFLTYSVRIYRGYHKWSEGCWNK